MAGYIGSKASVVSSGAERKKVFDITTTTTSLTGCSYTPNQVNVFHNGVRLVQDSDFTATDGSTVTLTTAAQSGDEVVVISYATFQTSDTVSASAGGTFSNAVTIDADGATVLTVDRATSDGTIIDLQKDGTSAGNLGSLNSARDLHVNSTGGILTLESNFNSTERQVVFGDTYLGPRAADSGAVDLGRSVAKFKDLYLSGGVYVGGTGAANYLDDYEEGTFTPVFASTATNPTNIAYANQDAEYVKIGNWVTCFVFIKVTSFTDNGGNLAVKNLPFTAASTSGGAPWYSGTIAYSANFSVTPRAVMVEQGQSRAEFWKAGSTSDRSDVNQRLTVSEANSNWQLYFTVTYATA